MAASGDTGLGPVNEPHRQASDVISFGPFELYPLQRRLLRDRQPVHLGSRAFEILRTLVENAGALVRKEDLIARVWPDTHVEEVALRVHLSALRRVLGDGRPHTNDLVNIPGRGYQFVAPISVRGTAGPPPELAARRPVHGLPALLTRAIGRDDDVRLITRRFDGSRCVTVTGTGGIGKTTVALIVGHELAPKFQDGTYLVDLAPVAAGQHVIDAVAAGIGVGDGGQMTPQTLAERLSAENILILIDNCEHVALEVAQIAECLTTQARSVRILCTSREPLRIAGEHIYRLAPLKTPSMTTDLSPTKAITYSAIELFVERAAASADRFVLNETNSPLVAAICAKLDGLPLAIEMAATRMDAFSVADIASMLEDRFRTFRQSRRTISPRHSSLLATLDWSYDMLPTEHRGFLHSIAAFSGRFTLEDALAVAGDAVLHLADLVDKSFIMVDVGGSTTFYRLYETMREYARQKSREAGDLEETKRRHAIYLATLFAKADAESERRISSDWLADYSRYLDDVRSALDWSLTSGADPELGISLTASAATLWMHLSLLNELQRRVEAALQHLGADAMNGARREMKLFSSLSYAMVYLYGPTPRGTQACWTALDIARKIGDYSSQERALLALWNGCFANGEVRHSLELAEQFMEVAANLGPADIFVAHRLLGSSHFYLGNAILAKQHMEIMVAGYGATSHDAHMARFGFNQLASARGLLALHLCFLGYFDQAMLAVRQAAAEAIDSNHVMTTCAVFCTSCIPIAIYTGCLEEARRYISMLFEQAGGRGLKRWENFARGFDGILHLREGMLKQGLEELSNCVAQADDRANTRYMMIFSEHALALGHGGNPKAGLTAIDKVLGRLADTGERWYFPELYRCRAQLLHLGGHPPSEVAAVFENALSLADEMSALTWSLRTAKVYAVFLQNQGRVRDSFTLLKKSYDAFTEGHDTPELASTRELLLGLGSRLGM